MRFSWLFIVADTRLRKSVAHDLMFGVLKCLYRVMHGLHFASGPVYGSVKAHGSCSQLPTIWCAVRIRLNHCNSAADVL